jgi:hypothetical protein
MEYQIGECKAMKHGYAQTARNSDHQLNGYHITDFLNVLKLAWCPLLQSKGAIITQHVQTL